MKKQNSPLILGTESVGKLLRQYAIPAIIAMTAASLYNMIDSVFIGHGVGSLAISGLAITFPLMNLAAAFGSLAGVGASTLVSVKLGQKDYAGANRVLGNVLIINIITGVLFTAVCLPFLDIILYFFGAGENTIGYAREYMSVILLGNVITHIYLGLNAILRSSGYPTMAMTATLTSVVLNCILNPIFIWIFDMGIKGAAWATIFSQSVSLVWQIVHFSKKSNLLHFQKGIFKLKLDLIKGIFSIGLSPFLMNICSSLIVILINRGLKEHSGDLAIGAYGIVNRVAMLFVMVVLGLNQGMQPIAGYNFGAKLYSRVTAVTRITIGYGVAVTTLGFVVCELFPGLISGLFTSDPEMIKESVYGLRIVFIVFPVVGFQAVASNFFLSIGMSKKAIFLSLTRQVLFLIPLLIILPRILGTIGVWVSMPVSDAIATGITSILLIRQLRKFKKENGNNFTETI
ncbi:MAG: MATE family efflux transporter [Cytophagaceae bacterium]|jgi:putative MATE family efflux protein|nr:MATE family efflux transporter [Cytophagaceae bacterium]